MLDPPGESEPRAPDEREPDDLISQLHARCAKAEITLEQREGLPNDGAFHVLQFPAGPVKRPVILPPSAIKAFLDVPFERFVFLGDYEAICSYSDGSIEAAIGGAGLAVPLFKLRQLLGEGPEEDPEAGDIPAWTITRPDGVTLSLGRSTTTYRAIVRGPERPARGLTLQIGGLHLSQHDQALTALETFANSLFFQFETALQIPIILRRRRTPRRGSRTPVRRTLEQINFPTYEYDRQPISLYWYGASAAGMPLLEFLAYYQAIEFYFPVYSEYDARRRLRYVLKDPLFDPQSDVALGRLLSVVDARRGGTYGSERDQLRATIEECVTEADLVDFITETDQRAQFFRTKHPRLTSVQLRVGEGATGIRDAAAERIYDVRCRIVHAKESETYADAILPFSAEADLLGQHDIELVRFLARRVLVAASRPLSL